MYFRNLYIQHIFFIKKNNSETIKIYNYFLLNNFTVELILQISKRNKFLQIEFILFLKKKIPILFWKNKIKSIEFS